LVPATLLTNDPAQARASLRAQKHVIYKPLTSGVLDAGRVIYASPVDADGIDDKRDPDRPHVPTCGAESPRAARDAVDGEMFRRSHRRHHGREPPGLALRYAALR